MNVELRNSIENLYAVFAGYPRPAKIEVCPCGCTPPDAAAPLVAVPLRSVRFIDMTGFAFSALTTQGSDKDFRYLLPRLFEGLVEFNFPVDPEIVFGKLSYAKWRSWPSPEIAAIEEFVAALWAAAITTYPVPNQLASFCDIESVLSSIAVTGLSLDPYLKLWAHVHCGPADVNLIQFVACNGERFADGADYNGPFWDESPEQGKQLRQWLLLPDTMQRVRQAANVLPDDGCEHLLAQALQTLETEFARSRA